LTPDQQKQNRGLYLLQGKGMATILDNDHFSPSEISRY